VCKVGCTYVPYARLFVRGATSEYGAVSCLQEAAVCRNMPNTSTRSSTSANHPSPSDAKDPLDMKPRRKRPPKNESGAKHSHAHQLRKKPCQRIDRIDRIDQEAAPSKQRRAARARKMRALASRERLPAQSSQSSSSSDAQICCEQTQGTQDKQVNPGFDVPEQFGAHDEIGSFTAGEELLDSQEPEVGWDSHEMMRPMVEENSQHICSSFACEFCMSDVPGRRAENMYPFDS
jgi:hypothetical protein